MAVTRKTACLYIDVARIRRRPSVATVWIVGYYIGIGSVSAMCDQTPTEASLVFLAEARIKKKLREET